MPYGLKRYQQAESLHFITFSCFHRLPYLSDSHSKQVVETILEQTRLRHEACIDAYVLMPERVVYTKTDYQIRLIGARLTTPAEREQDDQG